MEEAEGRPAEAGKRRILVPARPSGHPGRLHASHAGMHPTAAGPSHCNHFRPAALWLRNQCAQTMEEGMSNTAKWVVGIIVVVVVVVVLWFAFGQQEAMTPETPAAGGTGTETTPPPAPEPAPAEGGTTTTQ